MIQRSACLPILLFTILLAGCDSSAPDAVDRGEASSKAPSAQGGLDPSPDEAHGDETEHAHDETPLGSCDLDGLRVEVAQGHGVLRAGEEAHLVVKLPYTDSGATIVRAWLGGPDRTQSFVGRGEYAASHDDYDLHAVAPDPLPDDCLWWIEIAQPDGTKRLGSVEPLK